MTRAERIQAGMLYFCDDEEWVKRQVEQMDLLFAYNNTRPTDMAKRREILDKFLGGAGENLYLEPPFHANWGMNTYFGDNCYANFNLTLVDDGEIRIGNNVMFAPNVVISTTGHPIQPSLRKKVAQFSIPVTIGNNVWVGANVSIMPGVTIGDNSVIGAGSVVTRDIPAGVVAMGVPCRVVREIGEHDREFYFRDKKIDPEMLALMDEE